MVQNYNVYEIFEIAQQIEKSGGSFYRKAANAVEDEKSKEFLNQLADMESVHESYFQSLMNKYKLYENTAFIDLESQSAGYLHAVAEGYVRTHLHQNMSFPEKGTMADILEQAIKFEESTVVYFSALKASIRENSEKEKIESLILEELSHISILLEKLRTIESSN